MEWEIVLTTPLRKGLKKLEGNEWLRTKVLNALEEIGTSDTPRQLGRLKKGELDGCYGYDLSSDCRILYSVDDNPKRITFHRVCSHKVVYQ